METYINRRFQHIEVKEVDVESRDILKSRQAVEITTTHRYTMSMILVPTT